MIELLTLKDCSQLVPNEISDEQRIHVLSNGTMHNVGEFLAAYGVKSDLRCSVVIEPFNCIEQFIIQNKAINYHAVVSLVFDGIEMADMAEFAVRVKDITDMCCLSDSTYYFIGVPIYSWLSREQKHNLRQINSDLKAAIETVGNAHFIDLEPYVLKFGEQNVFHDRFLFSSKVSFKELLISSLSQQIVRLIFWARSSAKKCFVVDCDNTLWGGVIGEDGISGIKYCEGAYPGNVFKYIQSRLLGLKENGIILAINSKNNIDDIMPVLNDPSFALNVADFSVIKCNWNSKANNLLEISEELNISLESMVFMDDSDFEIGLVNQSLPGFVTLQVPKHIYRYPDLFNDFVEANFDFSSLSAEDLNRSELYQSRDEANKLRDKMLNHDDYLISLNMKCDFHVDNIDIIERVSQLTSKTNQFNFFKEGYQPHHIRSLCVSVDNVVFSLNVEDRFGALGITNVSLVNFRGHDVFIESFLMSCRVI